MLDVDINTVWIIAVLLVAVRMGFVFFTTPLYSFAPIPAKVKIIFVLALSAVLVFAANPDTSFIQITLGGLVTACLTELFIAGILAFGIQVTFAAFQWGGRVVDMQIGFSVANIIDPATKTRAPLMGTILSILVLMVFYSVDGHHFVIRGLAYSLKVIPPGGAFSVKDPMLVVGQFGAIFSFGLMAVAPVVFSLTMIDFVIAIAAKTMPQMNVFFVGLPLKIFVGLAMFALTIKFMLPLFERVFSSMFNYWDNVMVGG